MGFSTDNKISSKSTNIDATQSKIILASTEEEKNALVNNNRFEVTEETRKYTLIQEQRNKLKTDALIIKLHASWVMTKIEMKARRFCLKQSRRIVQM